MNLVIQRANSSVGIQQGLPDCFKYKCRACNQSLHSAPHLNKEVSQPGKKEKVLSEGSDCGCARATQCPWHLTPPVTTSLNSRDKSLASG